ncbi:hypothetical protein AB0I22_02925 [Streptomyces sp. NPDC050610]
MGIEFEPEHLAAFAAGFVAEQIASLSVGAHLYKQQPAPAP